MTKLNAINPTHRGVPLPNVAAAAMGIGLGLFCFFGVAVILGSYHTSLVWLLGWAMFWAPSFCTIDGQRIERSEVRQVVRDLGVLGATAATIFTVLYAPYWAGSLLAG